MKILIYIRSFKVILLSEIDNKTTFMNSSICFFCCQFPKNSFGNGCCGTCAKTNGHYHGQTCISHIAKPKIIKSICIFCCQYPKNNFGDGCCGTCAKTRGHSHGQTCISNNIPRNNACQRNGCNFLKNKGYDYCCRSCSTNKGHGQGCTGSKINISNDIKFYNKNERYYEFTNFYPIGFVGKDGQYWASSEHYFQAHKFTHIQKIFDDIKTSSSAKNAFKIARNNDIYKRGDWNNVKDNIMIEALNYKFTQNSQLKQMLKSTGNKKLIENSPVDSYWGCGANKMGQNKLGKFLMKIREQL